MKLFPPLFRYLSNQPQRIVRELNNTSNVDAELLLISNRKHFLHVKNHINRKSLSPSNTV